MFCGGIENSSSSSSSSSSVSVTISSITATEDRIFASGKRVRHTHTNLPCSHALHQLPLCFLTDNQDSCVLLSSSVADCKRVASEQPQPGGCIVVAVAGGGDIAVDVLDLHVTCDASFVSLMTTVMKLVAAVSSALRVQLSPSPAAAAPPLVTISCPTAEIWFRTLQANDTRPLVDQVSDTYLPVFTRTRIRQFCICSHCVQFYRSVYLQLECSQHLPWKNLL